MKPRRLSPPGSEMMVSRFLQGRWAERPSVWGLGGHLLWISPHAPGPTESLEQNPPGCRASYLHHGQRDELAQSKRG